MENESATVVTQERPSFVSKAQQVGDQLSKESKEKFGPKPLDKNPVADEDVSSEQNKTDGLVEKVVEDQTLDNKFEKKDKAEARKLEIQAEIDSLTRQKKEAQEEIDRLNAQREQLKQAPEEAKSQEKRKFTRDELLEAWKKAEENSDADLKLDVITYMFDEKTEQYEDVVRFVKSLMDNNEKAQQASKEWQETLEESGKFVDDEFKKDPQFNLSDPNSDLFKTAKQLYENPDNKSLYRVPGGMSKAVRDAYSKLLKLKLKGSPQTEGKQSNEVDVLKNRLEKEKRKSSLGFGPESVKEDQESQKISSDHDKLLKAINDKRKFQRDRMRGAGV